MSKKRKIWSSDTKAKVALEAIKERKTGSQICSEYGIASSQLSTWKKQLLDHAPEVFQLASEAPPDLDIEKVTAPLYEEIGRLKVELDWLKKKSKVSDRG